VNGEADAEFSRTAAINDTDAALYIGVNPAGGDEYFSGAVDEVAVVHDALSQDEIQLWMKGLADLRVGVRPKHELVTVWSRIQQN
jgi:hypothetical protein